MKKDLIKQKMKRNLCKAAVFVNTFMTFTYVAMANAYAKGASPAGTDAPINWNTAMDFNVLESKMVNLVFQILRIVGVFVAATGFGKIFLSIKDERPEDIKGGVTAAISGVILVMMKSFLKFIGVLT